MKIVICGSVGFANEIKKVKEELEKLGHETNIPYTTQKILAGEISLEDFNKEKEKNGDESFRKKAEEDLIKRYYNKIKESDAIIILNIDKKGIKNYIGGNTFLEIGFAHILDKKIFLFNDIPDMLHSDEVKAMNPIIINGDLEKVK